MPDEEKPDPPKTDPRKMRGAEVPPPENDSELPERWNRGPHGSLLGGLSRVLLLGIVLAGVVLPFTPYAGRIKKALNDLVEKARETKVVIRKETVPVIHEKIVEVPAPPLPLPSSFVPRKEVDVATLFNGISIQTTVDAQEGTYASLEVKDKGSYTVDFQVKLRVPKPNDTLSELGRVNPDLPKMLPGLDGMLQTGKVSGFYHKLYEKKIAFVQQNLTRLNKLLDKHNFFDCETILELTHPETKRKALLVQSEMDVVSDGSDGDRMPNMSSDMYNSDYYQPFTSYEWPKRTTTPNPLIGKYQARYEAMAKEYNQKGLSKDKSSDMKSEMQELDVRIKAMKSRSSLIADKDPFIVISLLFKDYPRVLPHAPALGDYAAVIHGNQILPAICGDFGPAIKMGEASLMVAKKISEKATPYNRPVDDLKVTYLIFPGTAEKPFGPPDLDHWYAKVCEYLTECGGVGDGYAVHKWENPFPPPTTTTAPALVVTQQAPTAATTGTNPTAAAPQAKQDNAPKPPTPSAGTPPVVLPPVIPETKAP